MLVWMLSAALAAPCGQPSTVAGLSERLDSAEQAFGDVDVDGFLGSLDTVVLMLPCLDAPIPTAEAARLHRLWALRALGAGDTAGANASVTSARALDPSTPYPDGLVPEGHPMRVAWSSADLSGAPSPVRPPRSGTAYIDGIAGAPRYADRAHVFQVFDGDGQGVTGAYLPAGATPPAYERAPAELPVATGPQEPPRERRVRPGRLAMVSGVVLLGGVATFASAGNVADPDEIPDSFLDAEEEAADIRLRTGVGEALMITGGVGLGASVVFWGLR